MVQNIYDTYLIKIPMSKVDQDPILTNSDHCLTLIKYFLHCLLDFLMRHYSLLFFALKFELTFKNKRNLQKLTTAVVYLSHSYSTVYCICRTRNLQQKVVYIPPVSHLDIYTPKYWKSVSLLRHVKLGTFSNLDHSRWRQVYQGKNFWGTLWRNFIV